MKFEVADLKLLNEMVRYANTDDEILLSKRLYKKQPGFYEEIDDVRGVRLILRDKLLVK